MNSKEESGANSVEEDGLEGGRGMGEREEQSGAEGGGERRRGRRRVEQKG